MSEKTIQELSAEERNKSYQILFKTLSSKNRQKILHKLKEEKCCVSTLSEEVGIEQTQCSHDLKRLRRCGLIEREKQGRYRYYSIKDDAIQLLEDIDEHVSKNCIHILRGER